VSAGGWVAVALLGGAGAVLRALVSARGGTLTVNLTGSLALGLLTGAGIGGQALVLAGGGFLGAYTTFSAWMLEADGSPPGRALLLPLLAGFAALALGRLIGAGVV